MPFVGTFLSLFTFHIFEHAAVYIKQIIFHDKFKKDGFILDFST